MGRAIDKSTRDKLMIRSAFPPARYLVPLCHQKWATEEILPRITEVPILFLSGLKDEIIPYAKPSPVPLPVLC